MYQKQNIIYSVCKLTFGEPDDILAMVVVLTDMSCLLRLSSSVKIANFLSLICYCFANINDSLLVYEISSYYSAVGKNTCCFSP